MLALEFADRQRVVRVKYFSLNTFPCCGVRRAVLVQRLLRGERVLADEDRAVLADEGAPAGADVQVAGEPDGGAQELLHRGLVVHLPHRLEGKHRRPGHLLLRGWRCPHARVVGRNEGVRLRRPALSLHPGDAELLQGLVVEATMSSSTIFWAKSGMPGRPPSAPASLLIAGEEAVTPAGSEPLEVGVHLRQLGDFRSCRAATGCQARIQFRGFAAMRPGNGAEAAARKHGPSAAQLR